MRRIVVACPSCKRPVAKDVYLRPESMLTIRCFHCGDVITIIGTPDRVITRVYTAPVENLDLTDDENSDTVFLKI